MAMWNLNGEDITRAKEELKGRRAAIQARYESELKQLETDIADLETFEQFAVRFVSDFKPGDEASPQPLADSVVAEIVAQVTGDQGLAASEAPAAEPAPAASPEPTQASAEPAAAPEPAAGQRSSSRWRMRLNTTGEATP